jgi:four helix bundle protein
MTAFANLEVWEKSVDLVSSIYKITKAFPKEELYTLTSQIRRAAISIPSNISEGRAKRSTKEFIRFVNIASGSAAELETHIVIGERLGYISTQQKHDLLQSANNP